MRSKSKIGAVFLSLVLLCSAVLCATDAFAFPAKIVIFRHAEKPKKGKDLSSRGYARAAALVEFFQNNILVNENGNPVAIYAAAPEHKSSSMRPIETVTPLAKSLNLDINTKFTRTQITAIAAFVGCKTTSSI